LWCCCLLHLTPSKLFGLEADSLVFLVQVTIFVVLQNYTKLAIQGFFFSFFC